MPAHTAAAQCCGLAAFGLSRCLSLSRSALRALDGPLPFPRARPRRAPSCPNGQALAVADASNPVNHSAKASWRFEPMEELTVTNVAYDTPFRLRHVVTSK